MISSAANTPKRLSIQELKKKYETSTKAHPKTLKVQSPILLKKFKVKEMTSMFNKKSSQVVKNEEDANESPSGSSKPPTSSGTLPKPLPLPRTRYTREPIPVPSPRSKSLARMQKKQVCFVAEDVFAKLTVKDKASLYTQFVNDMSRKNPKFSQHAEILASNIKKEVARGEVINEKQESVKRLLENLEARCAFPKQRISPAAIEILKAMQRPSRKAKKASEILVKSKEFEDVAPRKASHISTITITLQNDTSVEEQKHRRARSLPRRRTDGDQLLKDLGLSEPSNKRNSDKMRTTLSIEAYAPPKKIRRTRAEHLAPKQFFQNQQLEKLFYSWLKERHEREESQEGRSNEMAEGEEQQQGKSSVDILLEEAIAKLGTVEIKQKQQEEEQMQHKEIDSTTPKPTPRKMMVPSNETPITVKSVKPMVSSECSATSSAKHSNAEDSESGISNVKKNTSEASPEPTKDDSGFLNTAKTLRKKKMRRTLSWRKDSSLVETNTISSTDNESDFENAKLSNKKSCNKPQIGQQTPAVAKDVPVNERASGDLNKSQNIVSKQEDYLETDVSSVGQELCFKAKKELRQPELPRSLTESFDQGFETGSNDMDSPVRITRKSSLQSQSPLTVNCSMNQVNKNDETPASFSTPVKALGQQNLMSAFNESAGAQQQANISPIALPLKARRRSIYDSESRRSSLAMQVIREDHPLEHHEMQSPRSNCSSTDMFFANAPTMDIADMAGVNSQKSSSFWIKSGDFFVALDIHKNETERVKLLYEIFSQRSCDTKDIHFGIDCHTFTVHDSKDVPSFTHRLPHIEGCSQYWFSTGDMAIPFSGKLISEDKIKRLFQFVKSSVEETGILNFGVDEVEFSGVCELWSQSPKFSMESQYSMLVGLQSGNSNGLEGRSKYAWPHSKPVPVSDLDQSDVESYVFDEENDSTMRLSVSPFENKPDLASLGVEDLLMPRNSDVMMMSSDSFGNEFENESLDQLFEDKKTAVTTADDESTPPASVPEMLNILKTQHERLSSVKERLSAYHQNPTLPSYEALDALKGTPEYLQQLRNIVSGIGKIGSSDGFKNCSMADLERYMFFLSRYADICLNSCSNHMDKILDALMDQRAVYV